MDSGERVCTRGLFAVAALVLLFGVYFTLSISPAKAQATDWTGVQSTDWFAAGNWTNGVPGGSTTTTIDTNTPNTTVLSGLPGATATITVGATGIGDLSIQSGGKLNSGPVFLGSAGTGSVTVDGAGSIWTASNLFEVGSSGTGKLFIKNGGSVSSGGQIGQQAGSNGTVTVDGSGSKWTVTATNVGVGVNGTGNLFIQNGGMVSSGDGFIGQNAGSTGMATVNGVGSTWAVSGDVFVGDAGAGSLVIQNGSTVSNVNGGIGENAGSTGSATVDGAGSKWTNTGTLAVGDLGTGTLTLSNGGTASASLTLIGFNPGGTGTLNIGAGAGQSAAAPGTLDSPAVQFGSGTGAIVFNHTSNNYVFAPLISGPGSVNVLAGTTIFNGANTYTGPTTVNGGALVVNGSIVSSVSVNSGMLSGTGTVGNVTVNNGGIFAPGSGVPGSSMTVNGSLAFQAGALYLVQVNPTSSSSAAATTATLTGGSVQAVFASGSYLTHQYTILHTTTANGLGGTQFSGVSNVPSGFTTSLSYSNNQDVLLDLTAVLGSLGTGSLDPSGLSQNQQNVASALNGFFNNGGALPPNFVTVFGSSGANLGTALTQLSGEAATGAQQGAFQLTGQFLGLMLDPFVDGRGGLGDSFALALPADANAGASRTPPVKAAPVSFEQRWTAWGGAYGGSNSTSGDPAVVGSHDLTARAGGVAAGLDYRLTPDTVAGFALAGGATNWALAQGLGGGKSDAFQLGAYAATRSGPAYLAASLAFADHWMSTDRFAFAGDHLIASFNAQTVGGRVEGGYRFATPVVATTPYGALQAQSFHTPGYSETDVTAGGFGLAYDARTATDVRSELGARIDRATAVDPGLLILRGKLAWAHDWVSDPTLTAAFQALPGASFIVNGAMPATDSALVSVGAELRLANGIALLGKFDGEFARSAQTYAGTATIRAGW